MNTTMETHYSGYTNQQTYNTVLMYDEVFQDITITHLRRNRASTTEAAINHLMDAFENIVVELETSDLPTTGMARDIVEMYLSDVDWWNIADTYVAMHVNLLEQLA